ncbi:DUF192 domain-containing protein [Tropicimonas sp. IMCC34011]|uniref:DUF192 domain-containing protein n=1 Tax=Tropicimonas sp. IMCC34011 TaxID=2248759 RepID=UPI000E275388|nr:DUF192 domain-containing protein [Tropicimonas sp. IMCC34011]
MRVLGLAAGFAALLAGGGAASAQVVCNPAQVQLRGDWGQARFRVDVADDPAERAKGLMFVEEMSRGKGMLFIYDAPQRASFWMKNTLIPLDMVFVGPDGIVTRVHDNAVPHDETPIDGGEGVYAVLEINGGLAEALGIEEGSQMRHPAFGEEAAWPCE